MATSNYGTYVVMTMSTTTDLLVAFRPLRMAPNPMPLSQQQQYHRTKSCCGSPIRRLTLPATTLRQRPHRHEPHNVGIHFRSTTDNITLSVNEHFGCACQFPARIRQKSFHVRSPASSRDFVLAPAFCSGGRFLRAWQSLQQPKACALALDSQTGMERHFAACHKKLTDTTDKAPSGRTGTHKLC